VRSGPEKGDFGVRAPAISRSSRIGAKSFGLASPQSATAQIERREDDLTANGRNLLGGLVLKM